MGKVYNFSAGPAILPREVLEQAQQELLDYGGSGISLLESSHRSAEFTAVNAEAQAMLRELLAVSDDYAVLFLQGGASQQFAMAPMNFLPEGGVADYTLSGAWASKAIKEAQHIGKVHIAADCAKDRPTRVPKNDELDLSADAAYVHLTSNETISGAQWHTFPDCDAPLIADMSSDILSRPLDVDRFGLIYAGAQKNLGPAGVTLVIIRRDLVERGNRDLPAIFQYRTHVDADSLYNTPPCFSVYLVGLCAKWVSDQGGLETLGKRNQSKADKIYAVLDATEFYAPTADPACRSTMNVTFRLASEELEARFVKEATAQGLKGLKGHRSVGGVRASIYNAFPEKGVDVLVDFMKEFENQTG